MRKTITITSRQDHALNELAEFLLENSADLVDRLDRFELIAGEATLLGAGDPPIKRIVISAIIDDPKEEDENDLEVVISLLNQRASQLKIVLEFVEE